uniref:Microtubule-associated protein futsch n=1 Tax=Trichobilharzia regenti TaxID=157069 RepID=A0AA85KFI8_TRIRE|nr:unnamed protein product [Trichobilharzia regenti]
MPRRSSNSNSEESPVARRTSARIAAAQAASPTKSPVKSPRKRQSTEATKLASEDTESQQSQVKSEDSMEEMNGIDNLVKDTETTLEQTEIPQKKAKVIEETSSDNKTVSAHCVDQSSSNEKESEVSPSITHTQEINAVASDFEIVEHTSVPSADSAEVQAAISVQGEDGQLLVGFVQVDREELPAANSLEIKQIIASEPESEKLACGLENVPKTETISEFAINNLNGTVESKELAKDDSKANGTVDNETHHKATVSSDQPAVQSLVAPAAGDIVPEVVPEMISQQ